MLFENIENPINNDCSITHEKFNNETEVSRINYCGHIFNKDTLKNWLKHHQTCLNCRYNILTNSNLVSYRCSDNNNYIFTPRQFRQYIATNVVNSLFNSDSSRNVISFAVRR